MGNLVYIYQNSAALGHCNAGRCGKHVAGLLGAMITIWTGSLGPPWTPRASERLSVTDWTGIMLSNSKIYVC